MLKIFKNTLAVFFTISVILIGLMVIAGNISSTSIPEPTMYTLTDIYNLIHNETVDGSHNLYPSSTPTATTSYSVSQIYADLANLIKRENIATDTVYLGVTGDYGNPDPSYATTSIIASDLVSNGAPDSFGYSLNDICVLINDNATTTAGEHSFTSDSAPESTMCTLTYIYTSLADLIEPTKVKVGEKYLGVTGAYCGTLASGFFAGDGSAEDPYQICSWTQLNNVRDHLDSDYILTTDLSSADDDDYAGLGDEWVPIGDGVLYFGGNFNGDWHTISDLIINSTEIDYIGFFGSSVGVISNIGLINTDITGRCQVGGLVGYLAAGGSISDSYSSDSIVSSDSHCTVGGLGGLVGYVDSGSSITDSYFTGQINSNNDYVGGLVGYFSGTEISRSYSEGGVSGNRYVGGLVGFQNSGIIEGSHYLGHSIGGIEQVGGLVGAQNSGSISTSFAEGNFSAPGPYVGGLVGLSNGTIINSYSDMGAMSQDKVGGLVGCQSNGSIVNSYSVGGVWGIAPIGGLVGLRDSGDESGSFWDIETSGQTESAGGTGTTTMAMQTPSTFIDAGWSEAIWNLVEGSYPTLK